MLLAVMFWSPPGIRLAICLFAFVTFVRLTDAVAVRRPGIVLSAVAAAIIMLPVEPFDWISISPESVSIGSVDAVRINRK